MQMSTDPDKPRRVVIVEDHAVVREGLTRLIDDEADLKVCGEAASVAEGMDCINALKPDLVLVDLSLKDSDGLELVRQVHARYPAMLLLVLSMHDESLHAERAVRSGARGYIMKQSGGAQVIAAIRTVLAGEIYFSPQVTSRVLARTVAGDDVASSPLQRLSDREFEIYRLIGRGVAPREIARRLGLSVRTVGAHRDHIKQKLGLTRSAELTRHAVLHESGPVT